MNRSIKRLLAVGPLPGILTGFFLLLGMGVFAEDTGPMIASGAKIAFLGDSITQRGADHSGGYARLVISGLAANGIKAEPVFAGIEGHKSNDMLSRLDRDVISKKPDFMTLSCGVNDVWAGNNGIPLDTYKENITAIVGKAKDANVKVIILTSTMIGENQADPDNQKLTAYNDFLRGLAKERGLPLADLNARMQAVLKFKSALTQVAQGQATCLTIDGVHMNPLGDQMMAEGVLCALGLDNAQIAKAKAVWLEIPDAISVRASGSLTLKDYDRLLKEAAKNNMSLDVYLNKEFSKMIKGDRR